jgi:hypothetical protein
MTNGYFLDDLAAFVFNARRDAMQEVLRAIVLVRCCFYIEVEPYGGQKR